MCDQIDILIPHRFNGPPNSANGGVAAGLAASLIKGTAQVSLHAPPPLDTAMELVPDGDAYVCRHDAQTVLVARAVDPLDPPPAPPTLAQAREGHKHFVSPSKHAFPGCFVCGPDRTEDGLCIFAGKPEGFDGVTDVWTPDESLAGPDGLVRDDILWAAIDCPGAFAIGMVGRPMLLARMTAEIHERPKAGEELIVAGWETFEDGRKHGAVTALFTADGKCLAQAEQLWIEIRAPIRADPVA